MTLLTTKQQFDDQDPWMLVPAHWAIARTPLARNADLKQTNHAEITTEALYSQCAGNSRAAYPIRTSGRHRADFSQFDGIDPLDKMGVEGVRQFPEFIAQIPMLNVASRRHTQ